MHVYKQTYTCAIVCIQNIMCTYTNTKMHVYKQTYTCTKVCIHNIVRTYTNSKMHVYKQTYTCTKVRIQNIVCTYTNTKMYVYTHWKLSGENTYVFVYVRTCAYAHGVYTWSALCIYVRWDFTYTYMNARLQIQCNFVYTRADFTYTNIVCVCIHAFLHLYVCSST